MKIAYDFFQGFFVFFFITKVFNNIFVFAPGNPIASLMLPAALFGVAVLAIPFVAGFLKQEKNNASYFLISLLLSLLYYVLITYVFRFVVINVPGAISFGISTFAISIEDRTIALFVITLISSALVTLLKVLFEQAKKAK